MTSEIWTLTRGSGLALLGCASALGLAGCRDAIDLHDPEYTPFVDISAGQAQGGYQPSIVVEPARGKLLVTASAPPPAGLYFSRCDLDGRGCAASFDSSHAAVVGASGLAVREQVFWWRSVIDEANGRVLVFTASGTTTPGVAELGLRTCTLDAVGCSYRTLDTSASWGVSSRAICVDTRGEALIAVGSVARTGPVVFRCPFDGTACASTMLSVLDATTQTTPTATMFEPTSQKLLVFFDSPPGALRCDPDGSNCAYASLAGTAPGSTVLDERNAKILIPMTDEQGVVRCELDFSGCIVLNCAHGCHPVGASTTVTLDVARDTMFISWPTPEGLGLTRCNLGGGACRDASIAGSVNAPLSAAIDPTTGNLLVVGHNSAADRALGLFVIH